MFKPRTPPPNPEPCSRHACDIQTCLVKNDFQHERCIYEISKLQKCCEKIEYKSVHCGSVTNIVGSKKPKA
ncbi:unnamed protein product [Calypogeia fissa]